MMGPTKKMKYKQFMSMPIEDRRIQSQYFRKNKSKLYPVILSSRNNNLPELPNCKFLINEDHSMYSQLNSMRSYIIKNSGHKITAVEGLYFSYNSKMLNSAIKVNQFMQSYFKNQLNDGWLHIKYDTQEIFGFNYPLSSVSDSIFPQQPEINCFFQNDD